MPKAQLENGYTRIANQILESLCTISLSPYEVRVLMCVVRKTYGFNKKEDWIANSQIVKLTNIHKAHVSRTVKSLKNRKIVTYTGNKIKINTDTPSWLPAEVTKKLPVEADTKEKKETIQKKEKSHWSADSFFSSLKENEKKISSKAIKFDVRDKDILYCIDQAGEWSLGNEVKDNTWIWWESFINRWISRSIRRHELATLSDKKEKTKSKKKRLTKAEQEEKEFFSKLVIKDA